MLFSDVLPKVLIKHLQLMETIGKASLASWEKNALILIPTPNTLKGMKWDQSLNVSTRDSNILSLLADPQGGRKKDLNRRGSSGNWIEDRVTWKEEMAYKRAMGYL
jgi:hypothetical protein